MPIYTRAQVVAALRYAVRRRYAVVSPALVGQSAYWVLTDAGRALTVPEDHPAEASVRVWGSAAPSPEVASQDDQA